MTCRVCEGRQPCPCPGACELPIQMLDEPTDWVTRFAVAIAVLATTFVVAVGIFLIVRG